MKPLEDKILVSPVPKKEVSDGGVILPNEYRARDSRGYVIAVGPGKYAMDGHRMELDVEIGDLIFYTSNAGTDIEFNGAKYLVLRQAEVLCKIPGSDE